jgi:hypothetical protein
MFHKLSSNHVLLAAPALVCAALFLVAYLLWPVPQQGATSPATFNGELAKSLIQLGSIAIVGAFAGAFIKFFLDEDIRTRELDRQSTQRKIELYNGFIDRTGTAYREAKASRRRLRFAGLTRKYGAKPTALSQPQWELYCEEALKISDIQLRLEQLKIEAATHPDLKDLRGAQDAQDVRCKLKTMESYLGRFVAEFELAGGTQFGKSNEKLDVQFDKMPQLSVFTDGSNTEEEGPFDKEFVDQHRALTGILQMAIVRLARPESVE